MLRNTGGVESVGLDDIRTCFKISAVNVGNDVRLRQHQKVVIAFYLLFYMRKTLATEIGFGELMRLNHRSHRTIEDMNAFRQIGFKVAMRC